MPVFVGNTPIAKLAVGNTPIAQAYVGTQRLFSTLEFGPFSIPWEVGFWASDPNVTAPAEGAQVQTWRNFGVTSHPSKTWTAPFATKPLYSTTGSTGHPALFVGYTGSATRILRSTHSASNYTGLYTLVVIGNVTTDDDTGDQSLASGPGMHRSSQAGYPWQQREPAGSDQQILRHDGVRDFDTHLLLVHRRAVVGADYDYISVDGVGGGLFSSVGPQNGWTTSNLGGSKQGVYVNFYAWLKRELTQSEQADLHTWSRTFYGTP